MTDPEYRPHLMPEPPTPLRQLLHALAPLLAADSPRATDEVLALLAPLIAAVERGRAEGISPRGRRSDAQRAALSAFVLGPVPTSAPGGLVAYRAPELGAGARATHASDVYAIAALARSAITAQPPPPWTLAALSEMTHAPAIAGAVGDVFWRALATDLTERPPTPQALLSELLAASAHNTPGPGAGDSPAAASARDRDAPTWATMWAQRRQGLTSAGVAAFLGLIVAVFGVNAARDSALPEPIPALASLSALASDPSPAFARELRSVTRQLNVRRLRERAALAGAQDTAEQAQHAAALSRAFARAAREVAVLPLTVNTRGDLADVVSTLTAIQSGYRTMARGARSGDGARYARGRAAVTRREARLQRQLRALTAHGYRIS